MKAHVILFVSALLVVNLINAQEYFPTNDGVKSDDPNPKAFTNAKIYITAHKFIDSGTLVIENGKIIAVGKEVEIPKNAVVFDLKGLYIYPSFIELYSNFGISIPKNSPSYRNGQYNPNRKGYYWNDHIRADQAALDVYSYDKDKAKKLIESGFGLINTHVTDGIVRGSSSLLSLHDGNEQLRVIKPNSAQYLSFSRSKQTQQAYPTSIMGAMALLRQFYLDTEWYTTNNYIPKDLAIEAFAKNKNLVQIFDAGSRLNAIRADLIGDENGVQYTIVGGGDEFERIKEIKATNAAFIIPLNFPKPYDVENPYLTENLSLELMREWQQKPANPKILNDNGIMFAFTTRGLKSLKDFKKNIQKAISYGLDEKVALSALTSIPAKLLGMNNIGNLKKGSLANFLITSGEIFDNESILYENWSNGVQTILADRKLVDIKGSYSYEIAGQSYKFDISGTTQKPKINVQKDSIQLKSTLKREKNWVYVLVDSKTNDTEHFSRISFNVDSLGMPTNAKVFNSTGEAKTITIQKTTTATAKKNDLPKPSIQAMEITYPNMAYGFDEIPTQETILFKNATVWTNELEGILTNTDVLVKKGEIAKIGKNLSNKDARVIDATGKHLTSGIIDEHSHIAASSINEAGHNSSAEVSIEDVINPDDINIYRNLAGGVTTIQILHGSANPIGGRSAIIKLKWGASAKDMIYPNSPKFIKFALGENVKQSNWGGNSRFPQTRMGVEQIYMDYFSRAKAYEKKQKSGNPFRKDIEMEVLLEILNKERFISCHSYVQSEINMLIKVAEKFDFNINTFTHILEGYKVADKMKSHGVGASTFSDWWAYKYEVNDAIPYNAAILHKVGVITAINSDDAEMSRRLNQEAAKAVKYGDVTEEEAWKMVTLNPAKLLHLDGNIGSVKEGKIADLVLWSGHPMSIYTKAEKTLIEGTIYFDINTDLASRNSIEAERNKLIKLMAKEKSGGAQTQAILRTNKPHMHCDYLD